MEDETTVSSSSGLIQITISLPEKKNKYLCLKSVKNTFACKNIRKYIYRPNLARKIWEMDEDSFLGWSQLFILSVPFSCLVDQNRAYVVSFRHFVFVFVMQMYSWEKFTLNGPNWNLDRSCFLCICVNLGICICALTIQTLKTIIFEVLVPSLLQKHITCWTYLQL